MEITYDRRKSAANVLSRGLSFDLVTALDWDLTLVGEDTRKVYPERRFQAVGYLGERLHVVIYSILADGIRVISLRKANRREVKRYEEATES